VAGTARTCSPAAKAPTHSHVRETLAAPEQPDQRRMIRSTADTRDRQENR